jgi:hypothetical protein
MGDIMASSAERQEPFFLMREKEREENKFQKSNSEL